MSHIPSTEPYRFELLVLFQHIVDLSAISAVMIFKVESSQLKSGLTYIFFKIQAFEVSEFDSIENSKRGNLETCNWNSRVLMHT
jgi:hypothetical protein